MGDSDWDPWDPDEIAWVVLGNDGKGAGDA